ncbi:MAG: AAA family ATPase [Spirochaetaceae bacterium]|nr:AAA family ATPase [Spirochaetaceae bacterium]
MDNEGHGFGWTKFYSEVADRLMQFRDDRSSLVSGLKEIAGRMNDRFPRIVDTYKDGTQGFLRDICPFTIIACFNRRTKDETRRAIANEIGAFVNVHESTPSLTDSQDGIPLLSPLAWWYFANEENRDTHDIEKLWQVFEHAIEFADSHGDERREPLERSYGEALSVKHVGVAKLTMGLFWIRPWSFPTLDTNSIKYIRAVLGENVTKEPSGAEYLDLRDRLLRRFQDPNSHVKSFPDLSFAAYESTAKPKPPVVVTGGNGVAHTTKGAAPTKTNGNETQATPVYSIDNIRSDGCFLSWQRLEVALNRLQQRMNLILQGPPGTGKTWLARRLAYALIGRRDDRLVKRLQFHPNLSYEDFVRGHRPEAGKLDLVDGPLLKIITAAQNDRGNKYVVVIEEINRGNPAQIFGEMLTLLEADKRNKDEALALAIPRDDNERVYIPPNVYVIGTMNVADRSLALVDLALRRRFTFVDLEPTFGDPWRTWMREQGGVDEDISRKIEQRMIALNEGISSDQSLGDQFRVGHSYVTTPPGVKIDDPVAWFREVVETEIAPLLREYWFDQTKTADDHQRRLLEGF